MKKLLKINKTLIVLGIIILISLISFLGLYIKENGAWKNLLKNYNLGTDFSGYRELVYSLDTSEEEKEVYVDDNGKILGYVEDAVQDQNTSIQLVEDENSDQTAEETEEKTNEYKTETRTIKANDEENITIENFKSSKQIIQKRLNTLNGLEYNIRMDNVTGDVSIEIPDNDQVSTASALISTVGKFDMIERESGIVLLDNSDLKSVNAVSNYEEEGYQLYLQITLNDEGKEKLKEISKKYVQKVDESGNDQTDYVSVRFEGQAILSTYFGEELTTGILTVPIGDPTTDQAQYTTLIEQASRIAYILNTGKLPLKYTLVSDNFINSMITEKVIFVASIVCVLVILIISAVLIAKYKLNGLILSLVSIGYIAITALLLRYANVLITLNCIYSIIVCALLNYLFIIKLLRKLKDNNLKVAFKEVMKEYYLQIIPVIVLAVVFTVISTVSVSSIGMTLFWGLLTGVIYNTLVIYVLKLV